ncbi:MAG: NADH-dependent [FeFe] hydrogenase, group A6 [Clostridiales bacterium]|nr:NADH-dependent [FeFe] hydrogenase, group A6 [Clostridiales bacterium]
MANEKKINITINGKEIQTKQGHTIIQAAREEGIYIPNLCYLEGIHQYGACRICMVEVEGARTLMAACMVNVAEGMVISTNTARARQARKLVCELILSDHPADCLQCSRSGSCKLQEITRTLGVVEHRFPGQRSKEFVEASPSLSRDMAKCILCRRCVSVCNKVQSVGILNAQNRGFATVIGPAMEQKLVDVDCTYCGQCINVCPVNALKETDAIAKVWQAINDPAIRVVVQVAPAVRVGIGEEFGLPIGSLVTGKLASALKELQFDDVFDANFGADLTIMEEGSEFLARAKDALSGGKAVLPMITSCSPGWIKFAEHNFPAALAYLSSCKSPHMMEGALIKSYYAEKLGIDPKDMFVVSVMPCTAKKFEASRPEMVNNGLPNVDAVLTTRELARMMREAGIDLSEMKESHFDAPMGLSSGAADIFGVSGGVMEAALRTVYELATGRQLPFDKLHVTPIVGLEQIKAADITFENTLPAYKFLEGFTVKVAVTSGLSGARQLMEQVAAKQSPYHFIEVMACPGGCIAGGGQPRYKQGSPYKEERSKSIYTEDEGKKLRKSHENPDIKKLYSEYLLEPLGHKSHELLHTHYTPRGKCNENINE